MAEASDGHVFTGRQALDPGLTDAFGDEKTARDRLGENHDPAVNLEAVNYG